ncbi:MAG: DUF2252 domain-containing protein [Proteobacteria bacterium]|nr:DUF2252 domain-containing protein [Pseudomonadota bacterium]
MNEAAIASIETMADRMDTDQADGALLAGFTKRQPSVEERMAAGKALRKTVPRQAHRTFDPGRDRTDPIEILERQNATRAAKLVPVRYGRMLASPFAFLRGSAAVMASDLAHTPVSGFYVYACGDMHVSNFGVFGSAERELVFAINDFDEVFPAPWEWDLKRLVASAAVAIRFMGGDRADSDEAVMGMVRSYRKRIARYAGMGHLEVWYDRIDERTVLDSLSPRVRRGAQRIVDKARAKGHQRVLEKMTEQIQGEHRIVEDHPVIVRETHTADGVPIGEALDGLLRSYIGSLSFDRRRLLARYRIVDVARKVVGVGSVGTGCWVVLLMGNDNDDPLFLQVKEAQSSVLEPYARFTLPFDNHGRRVVVGQRLIQGSPDIFLGWGELEHRQFYVRQLADMKGGVEMVEGDRDGIDGFKEYCRLCGWALALAHAKSGDPALIAGYCGHSDVLDEALAVFANAYADRTERDHAALEKARGSGRIEAIDDKR